jgi:hypothetical protein
MRATEMKTFALFLFVLALSTSAVQASHGGPNWEHDDPARRVYGGGG